MKRAGYLFLYGIFHGVSLLPLRVLYGVSDVSAWLLHSVLRYRRKVVRQNLVSSFPELTLKEIKEIEKGYYRFLGDYVAETIKLATMSEAQMRRRMKFRNPELPDADLAAGKDVTLYLGHYCNWEWVSSIPIHISSDFFGCQIYKPLHNKPLDKLFLKIRERFGAHCIKKAETLRELVKLRKSGKPTMTGYIADQVPNYQSIHLWLPFLNHDTGVFSGAERISKILDAKCYYLDIRRVKRGWYEAEYVPMESSLATPGAVTREYFSLLETTIRRAPQYWLWSHRRWKRTRQMQP